MTTHGYARFLIRGATRFDVEIALGAIMTADGYATFDAGRIPPGYPAEPREFDRWMTAGPDDAGTTTLIAVDVRRAFERSNALAAALPCATIAALVRPVDEPLRIKVYRDGALFLKVGEDPDEELFYKPLVADVPAVDAFLVAWGTGGCKDASAATVARCLGGVGNDASFQDAVRGVPATPVVLHTFISQRSRLYLEA